MKKILLGLLVLSSAVSFANQGINVYGKFGVDVVSRFNKISDEGETFIKSRGKVAPAVFLEATKNVTPDFEAGLGVGYIWRGKENFEFENEKNMGYQLLSNLFHKRNIPIINKEKAYSPMTKEEILQQLNDIFRRVLNNKLTLTYDMSAKDVDGWDSMTNLMLISEIEKHYDIHFKMREIVKLANVGELCDTILKKIA